MHLIYFDLSIILLGIVYSLLANKYLLYSKSIWILKLELTCNISTYVKNLDHSPIYKRLTFLALTNFYVCNLTTFLKPYSLPCLDFFNFNYIKRNIVTLSVSLSLSLSLSLSVSPSPSFSLSLSLSLSLSFSLSLSLSLFFYLKKK